MEGGDPSAGKSGVSEKIEYLYLLFTRNGIPWQTANAPYLYKMADMIVTGLPGRNYRQRENQAGNHPVWRIQQYDSRRCHSGMEYSET